MRKCKKCLLSQLGIKTFLTKIPFLDDTLFKKASKNTLH